MKWNEAHFEDIVSESAFGPRFSSECYDPNGNIATLRTTDISNDGAISTCTMPLARIDTDKFRSHFLKPGDLVISRSGRIGTTALFTGHHIPVLPGAFLIRFRLRKEQANPLFYKHYFNSKEGQQKLLSVAQGAAQQNINITNVKKIKVPTPSLKEQNAIAEIISSYENLIATNQRRIDLLEEASRLIYREWFVHLRFPKHESTHISTGIPEGWKSGSAHEFINILSGGTPKTSINNYWNGDIPFFTPKDSPNCFYTTDTEKSLTSEGLNNCNSRLFPKETIFITARGTVGKTTLSGRPMAMNQSCYALTPKEGFGNLFLFMAIRENISRLQKAANGGVFNAIVVDTFKHIPFLAPKPELTLAFDDKVRPLFEQVLTLIQQNRILAQARDLLLPKLMSGQIDVSNIRLTDEDVVM